jgi:hypothetical protein
LYRAIPWHSDVTLVLVESSKFEDPCQYEQKLYGSFKGLSKLNEKPALAYLLEFCLDDLKDDMDQVISRHLKGVNKRYTYGENLSALNFDVKNTVSEACHFTGVYPAYTKEYAESFPSHYPAFCLHEKKFYNFIETHIQKGKGQMKSLKLWYEDLFMVQESQKNFLDGNTSMSVLEAMRLRSELNRSKAFEERFESLFSALNEEKNPDNFRLYWQPLYRSFMVEVRVSCPSIFDQFQVRVESKLLGYYKKHCATRSQNLIDQLELTSPYAHLRRDLSNTWSSASLEFISKEVVDECCLPFLKQFDAKVLTHFMVHLPSIYSADSLFSIDSFRSYYGNIETLRYEAEKLAASYLSASLKDNFLFWAQTQIMRHHQLPNGPELVKLAVSDRLAKSTAFWHSLESLDPELINSQLVKLREDIVRAFKESAALFAHAPAYSEYSNVFYLCSVLLCSGLEYLVVKKD